MDMTIELRTEIAKGLSFIQCQLESWHRCALNFDCRRRIAHGVFDIVSDVMYGELLTCHIEILRNGIIRQANITMRCATKGAKKDHENTNQLSRA